jgi:general secretion pathway protein G
MLATKYSIKSIRRSAFTLVEVLVVMAIIVILAGTAVVGTMKFLENAKENNDESRMRNIITACKAVNLKSGGDYWPQDVMELVTPTDGGRSYLDGGQADTINPWGSPYQLSLQETPAGPKMFVISTRPNGATIMYPKN